MCDEMDDLLARILETFYAGRVAADRMTASVDEVVDPTTFSSALDSAAVQWWQGHFQMARARHVLGRDEVGSHMWPKIEFAANTAVQLSR